MKTANFIGGSKKLAIEEDVIYLDFDEAVWLHFELMWAWHENQIGVDNQRQKIIFAPFHLADNRRNLHKIRTRTDDV